MSDSAGKSMTEARAGTDIFHSEGMDLSIRPRLSAAMCSHVVLMAVV